MKQEVTFDAIRFKQTEEADWVAYFSSNIMDINNFSGIPQKRNFEDSESIGFQRTVKKERLESLVNFYSNKKNIIQNPLICATRNACNDTLIEFIPLDGYLENTELQVGELKITFPDYNELSLLVCLDKLKDQLLQRLPSLIDEEIDQALLEEYKEKYFSDEVINYDETSSEPEHEKNGDISFGNSHIKEFWQEVICRIELLKFTPEDTEVTEILGFTKESICSYLKPIVIVDGQHRLAGAIECAKDMADNEYFSEVTGLMDEGKTPEEATIIVQKKHARSLPLALLMTNNPEEHVFQFVVVNQKATPINKALLGTIVSTTLSDEELTRVTARLKGADIPLDDSQAISMVTRRDCSPFYGLVQTGIENEKAGKLQWSVMKGLVSLFRDLKGGKYYSSEDKNDHISNWSFDYLEKSQILGDEIADRTLANWQKKEIWYEVFKTFWLKVRDYFGNTSDPNEGNYWGNTNSNLFNKVYLNILAVDFFSYMNDKERSIDSIEDLEKIIDKWLDGTSHNYFTGDWGLEVKKDTPALRRKWNTLWVNYRKTPASRKRLPSKSDFSKF